LVNTGKYRTEGKLKIHTPHKLNTIPKKQTTQNTAKENYPGLVAFYDTWPRNEVPEVGLFYNTQKHTRGQRTLGTSKARLKQHRSA